MITADSRLDSIRKEALQRQARQRVDVLDEMRAAKNALDRGLTQRPIAELLMTSQARVSRLLKAIERRGGDLAGTLKRSFFVRRLTTRTAITWLPR